mgnify:CR=1 FL=1
MYEDLVYPVAPLLYGSAARPDSFAASADPPGRTHSIEGFDTCFSVLQVLVQTHRGLPYKLIPRSLGMTVVL